jgi:hypothetical protein
VACDAEAASRVDCLREADPPLAFPAQPPVSWKGHAERLPPPFLDHFGSMSDQTYDDGRARNLEQILRALAERIRELDGQGRLLENASELTKLLGEARSELFHYEVRATYDTPEVADNRRIVNDAIQQSEQGSTWQKKEWAEDGDDAPEW